MLRVITVHDARLATWDSGAGTPWVFVHGFPLDHSMWRYQLDRAPAGIRMIAPDLRGFGRSPRGTCELLSMAQHADDLAELLKQLDIDEPVTLCGLSMGGYVAFEFWRRHRVQLKRLVLCDTRAAADDETMRKARELTALRVLKEGTEMLVEAMMPKLFSEQSRNEYPYRVAAMANVIRRTDPATVAAALRGMARREDFTDQLESIDVPVTLVCGEEDAITPTAEMKTVADAIGRSEFCVIPGAGHMAPYEQPDAFDRVMQAD